MQSSQQESFRYNLKLRYLCMYPLLITERPQSCLPHQGGIKFKPELRVLNQDYGGMKVDHFVVEKR